MAGDLQPLDEKFPIVDQSGKPTLYFIKWCQQRQIDITEAITLLGLEEYLFDHPLQEGDGIALTPSGNISDSPSISVRNGLGLDFDGMLNLKIADTAVTPGTYGDATNVAQITVDQQGRIIAAVDVAITGGGGGSSHERTRVVPLLANFTLDNGGASVATDKTYGLQLVCPASASNIRMLRSNTAPPATPWAMIVRTQPLYPGTANTTTNFGLFLRNSGTGRIISFAANTGSANAGVTVQRYSAYATFNANILAGIAANLLSSVPWLMVTNDGTTLGFHISPDGDAWDLLATEPLATYITSVNQFGFGCQNVAGRASAIFQSYEVI